jgi:hypothetical protein
VRVNRNTGGLASPDDPFGVNEVFVAGTEPTRPAAEAPPTPDQFYQQQQ